jgi:DNA-binding HxlR family transcriptional regulator
LKKWSLPVLAALARPRRFSKLRAELPVTARGLALALRELEAAGLVRRTVTDDCPPQTHYEAAPSARASVRAARRLR